MNRVNAELETRFSNRLVILPDDLHQPSLVLREQREILHQVEQLRPVARPAQHHLQRHPARLLRALDALNASPTRTSKTVAVRKHLPIRRERADWGSAKFEVRIAKFSQFDNRNSSFVIPTAR